MTKRRLALTSFFALAACAGHDAQLEARVRVLEGQVTQLEQRMTASACKTTRSREFARATQLSNVVPFAVTRSDVRSGDAITIDEVRGDRARFEAGGAYVVRGTYALESADEAELAFTEQTTEPGLCSSSSGRDKVTVKRGRGRFELATALPFEGFAHVSFFVHGAGAGGVVFGRTEGLTQKLERMEPMIAK